MENQDKEIWIKAQEVVEQIQVNKANFEHIAQSGVINGSLLGDLQKEIFLQLKSFSENSKLIEENLKLREEKRELLDALRGLAKHYFVESPDNPEFPQYKTAVNLLLKFN